MIKKIKYGLVLVVCMIFVFILSGCGAGEASNYNNVEKELQETQKNMVLYIIGNYVDVNNMDLTNEEKNTITNTITDVTAPIRTNFDYSNTKQTLENALQTLYNVVPEAKKAAVEEVSVAVEDGMTDVINALKTRCSEIMPAYTTKKSIKDREEHHEQLCNKVLTASLQQVNNATTADLAGKVEEKEVKDSTDIYQIAKNFTILIAKYEMQEAPLQFYGGDEFWSHLFNNLVVFPIGWLIYAVSRLLGGYYILGLLIVTILVRTLGWPIYAKTNDMSLKMSLMQPEIQKLDEKYANRPDPESQRMKQMEQMQLYKKYKVGFGGCLMPLLQFPIFMGIYRAVSRMQYTDGTVEGTANWVGNLKANLFGVDLFEPRGEFGTTQFWGIVIILIIVVGTQILSQVQANARQKKANEERQSNIPEYRRQAVAQNDQAKTMKYMMYFMIFMMGMFVWQSPAGLGVYWCIGNLYSMGQTYINNKFSNRRMEKLKKKF